MQFRSYGKSPHHIFIIHGGPGAPGTLAALGEKLGKTYGVIEPFQTKESLEEQINELHQQINFHTDDPIILIGHSYGAILSYLFAAKFPEKIKHLIMISTSVMTYDAWEKIRPLRNTKLTEAKQAQISLLGKDFTEANFFKIGEIYDEIDNVDLDKSNYGPLSLPGYNQAKIYNAVRPEIFELRKSGKLLAFGKQITCPTLSITGDDDIRPKEGITILETVIQKFKHIELKNCGHIPWCERQARDEFYKAIHSSIKQFI